MPNQNTEFDIQFYFKDMEPTEALKNFATERSDKIKKFVQKNGTLKWSFEVDGKDHKASCHLVTESWNDYCDDSSDDMYQTIDSVIAKLLHLVQKQKEKMKNHH